MNACTRTLIAALLFVALPAVCAQAESRWEPRIKKFEEADAKNMPAPGGIVFVGSSSMVFWKTDTDFPEHKIINRGFRDFRRG